jgi:hypothetical protein
MKVLRLWTFFGILLVAGIAAFTSTGQTDPGPIPPDNPVIGLLSKGIAQLNINIDALSKRMAQARQASTGMDPALHELQALDLSGWQLHQQQWVIQRDHLVFARDSLQRASGQPGEKAQLLDQWRQHQHQYTKALDELRQQRHRLEDKHVEVEARLVERGLQ